MSCPTRAPNARIQSGLGVQSGSFALRLAWSLYAARTAGVPARIALHVGTGTGESRQCHVSGCREARSQRSLEGCLGRVHELQHCLPARELHFCALWHDGALRLLRNWYMTARQTHSLASSIYSSTCSATTTFCGAEYVAGLSTPTPVTTFTVSTARGARGPYLLRPGWRSSPRLQMNSSARVIGSMAQPCASLAATATICAAQRGRRVVHVLTASAPRCHLPLATPAIIGPPFLRVSSVVRQGS